MNSAPSPSVFGLYWTDFGGFRALVHSGYFWSSFGLTMLIFPLWARAAWWDDVISVIPSISGFSLSAYAILVAFWKDRFYKLITTPVPQKDGTAGPSVYATTSAAFVHFIFVQLLALAGALICKAWHIPLYPQVQQFLNQRGISPNHYIIATHAFWFLSYWVFIYALACGVAATTRVYLLARWYGRLAQSGAD